ncbi:MAG: hypothetical protein Q9159_004769 [Coniocarpon cinnabarinum]
MPAGVMQREAATHSPRPESRSYGQVIEYIENRLFLASYTHPPDEHTPFPWPLKQERSPSKRSSKLNLRKQHLSPVYFSIDHELLYNAFHADFGPLHIGHLYRFAVALHDVLGAKENEGRVVVFWSHADSRSRANAACVLACYMVLIQNWPPHLALAPISQMEPPLMPFRDAGYSQADYVLNVQDIVYGVWRAKEEGLCGLKSFNLAEYETFERVDMGDFNWITPHFVAFASPQHQPTSVIPPSSSEFATLPRNTSQIMRSSLPTPFKNVLAHFRQKKVGLVVRLNSELYSPSYFAALGMTHLDMIFEDGTCPSLQVVRRFIKLAHDMISKQRTIAVHCKAGLGRTGCLIGAYLIYRYGFTANEVIAFMRFMRPGMVVGPQQHWLHLNQGTFRQWWFEDSFKEKMALAKSSTPPRRHRLASNGQTFTPPEQQNVSGGRNRKRSALGELDYNDAGPGAREDNLPAPTPGQPRKGSKMLGASVQPYVDNENEPFVQPDTEVVTMERHNPQGDAESDEEHKLRMLGASRRPSKSPSASHKKRAVSCLTTMTMTEKREQWLVDDESGDTLMQSPAARKTPPNPHGINVGKRSSPVRKASGGGVRKTSGRVGSAGAVASLTRLKQ